MTSPRLLAAALCVSMLTSTLAIASAPGGGRGDDCNNDGQPDALLLGTPALPDCNDNGIPDECDVETLSSLDEDLNGVPDECEEPGTSELDCSEFDRYEDLTPNDTLTLLTSAHNPEHALGYLVVYVVDEENQPIAQDSLAGQLLAINGIDRFEYSVNPVDFRSPVAAGELTDLDGDEIRDLDGAEYELAPDELMVPRFVGQGAQATAINGFEGFSGSLILVDLNSGAQFDTTVDFLSYNDNEEVFSGEYTFNCWDKPYLTDISGAFASDFLKNWTNHDENESLQGREYGWFKFWGHVANSTAASLADPAIYGVYVERVGMYTAADLPFEVGGRAGHVLPRTITGDNSEGSGSSGESENLARRKPGSLLVYPEFNNLSGELTLLTVTYVSDVDDARVHFVYYGKYAQVGGMGM